MIYFNSLFSNSIWTEIF